jgi:hypothetical protein
MNGWESHLWNKFFEVFEFRDVRCIWKDILVGRVLKARRGWPRACNTFVYLDSKVLWLDSMKFSHFHYSYSGCAHKYAKEIKKIYVLEFYYVESAVFHL